MKKKNDFVRDSLSFEGFERAIAQPVVVSTPLEELVRDPLSAEKESRQKEREL